MSTRVDPRVIGEQIHRLRLRRHVSVRFFAAQTGFSASFISQLENGQVSPSIHSMQKIAAALGTSLGGFFAALQPEAPAPIVRARDRRGASSSWSRARVEVVGPLPAGSGFESLLITLQPGGRSGKHPMPHGHREFAFILDGRATLELGDRAHRLSPGDAVVLQANEPHLWANAELRRFIFLYLFFDDAPQAVDDTEKPVVAFQSVLRLFEVIVCLPRFMIGPD